MDCVFCNIVNKTIPANFLYETASVFVVNDLYPKAKVHVLVIPKRHIANLNELTEANVSIMQDIGLAIKAVTAQLNIAKTGYKVICNNGQDGGQVIPHLHFHVLGGEAIRGVT
ncbi:MAG: HIT domain-containing protein [Patescibacteria group bacterium]|jgi:histidine triad (HIT) family protein